MTSTLPDDLSERLAAALPRGCSFKYHHVATPPSSCAALYTPPPGHQSERTSCESHMLNVSISPSNHFARDTVSAFAIEVFVYRTRRLTTLFVSKADTTGWVSQLNVPVGHGSIIKTISATFVSYIVRECHRPNRRLVLSLFARAQSQYLYPGSDENPKKHILDDRQLVKWWCRTLDPVLREYEGEEVLPQDDNELDGQTVNYNRQSNETKENESKIRSQAYLIVPGHDRYETAAFFPSSAKADAADNKRWHAGHPLRELAPFPNAPPRCLVPHFPDDPKARFLLDLDVELKDAPPPSSQSQSQNGHSSSQTSLLNPQESPGKRGKGQWKSVKTLEQFWDMMAFRQECSSGRLVGFLWIVFTPDSLDGTDDAESISDARQGVKLGQTPKLTKVNTQPMAQSIAPHKRSVLSNNTASSHEVPTANTSATPKKLRKRVTKKSTSRLRRRKGRLTGVIVPRAPRIKQFVVSAESQQGTLVLQPRAYTRTHELLLRLDFANVAVASQSTLKWAREASILAGRSSTAADWGVEVTGQAAPTVAKASSSSSTPVTILGTKRKAVINSDGTAASNQNGAQTETLSGTVNVLNINSIRKKPKLDESQQKSTSDSTNSSTIRTESSASSAATVDEPNTLSASLVRKRPKSTAAT